MPPWSENATVAGTPGSRGACFGGRQRAPGAWLPCTPEPRGWTLGPLRGRRTGQQVQGPSRPAPGEPGRPWHQLWRKGEPDAKHRPPSTPFPPKPPGTDSGVRRLRQRTLAHSSYRWWQAVCLGQVPVRHGTVRLGHLRFSVELKLRPCRSAFGDPAEPVGSRVPLRALQGARDAEGDAPRTVLGRVAQASPRNLLRTCRLRGTTAEAGAEGAAGTHRLPREDRVRCLSRGNPQAAVESDPFKMYQKQSTKLVARGSPETRTARTTVPSAGLFLLFPRSPTGPSSPPPTASLRTSASGASRWPGSLSHLSEKGTERSSDFFSHPAN